MSFRIKRWNGAREPQNYERFVFLEKHWYRAREMARSIFGRDIPNAAIWEEAFPTTLPTEVTICVRYEDGYMTLPSVLRRGKIVVPLT